jgi:hypothetical protein
MTDTEADAFDAFETIAGIEAYIFNKFGAQGLRALLALIELEHSQEGLWRDAEMLADAGLNEAADIVLEVAETAVPERVLRCPYSPDDPDDRANFDSWQASYERWHPSRSAALTPQPEGQHEQRDAEHQCAPFDCLSYSIESSHRAQAKGKHDPRTAVEN